LLEVLNQVPQRQKYHLHLHLQRRSGLRSEALAAWDLEAVAPETAAEKRRYQQVSQSATKASCALIWVMDGLIGPSITCSATAAAQSITTSNLGGAQVHPAHGRNVVVGGELHDVRDVRLVGLHADTPQRSLLQEEKHNLLLFIKRC
jgi:hypothetical protein